MIAFKTSVEYWGTEPPAWYAIGVVDVIGKLLDIPICINSLRDGKHSTPQSLHYRGMAFDIDTSALQPEQVALLLTKAREILGGAYDVVDETARGHIHIEYDPPDRRFRLINWVPW